jgi:hypothetical protein
VGRLHGWFKKKKKLRKIKEKISRPKKFPASELARRRIFFWTNLPSHLPLSPTPTPHYSQTTLGGLLVLLLHYPSVLHRHPKIPSLFSKDEDNTSVFLFFLQLFFSLLLFFSFHTSIEKKASWLSSLCSSAAFSHHHPSYLLLLFSFIIVFFSSQFFLSFFRQMATNALLNRFFFFI